MKKLNLLLTMRQVMTLSLFAFLLFTVSCDEAVPEPEQGIAEGDVPVFAVVNVPVTFLDRSDDAASRAWTIEGGTPATSTDRSVDVTFTSPGSKAVTLNVVFDNGTVNSTTYSVNVAEELNVSIEYTETVTQVDNDIEVSVAFAITTVGEPDSYSWNFPGGTPETSTEANPTVVWLGGGEPVVSLTITRSADGASLEVSDSVEVGPENLFTEALWGFEAEDVLPSLQTWDGDASGPWDAGVVAQINNGYEGKAIEINFPGDKGYYGVISRDFWDSNAQLKKDDIVLLSYYAKSASGSGVLGFSRIVNHLPGWSIEDPANEQGYQDFANLGDIQLGSEWTRITKIDTLVNLSYETANNVFPEFGFNGGAEVFSFDKVELKVLGNLND